MKFKSQTEKTERKDSKHEGERVKGHIASMKEKE